MSMGGDQCTCQGAVFGDGVYLSDVPVVAEGYSKAVAGWAHSMCGHRHVHTAPRLRGRGDSEHCRCRVQAAMCGGL